MERNKLKNDNKSVSSSINFGTKKKSTQDQYITLKVGMGENQKMIKTSSIILSHAGKNSKISKIGTTEFHMFTSMDSMESKNSSKQNGGIYIDRDPETFEILINYLRNEKKYFPKFRHRRERELFRQELEFWEISYDQEKWSKEDSEYPVE